MSFSTVSAKEIINLGIVRSRLVFRPEGVKALLSSSNELGTADELSSLVSRLKDIFDHVNMDVSARMSLYWATILMSRLSTNLGLVCFLTLFFYQLRRLPRSAKQTNVSPFFLK